MTWTVESLIDGGAPTEVCKERASPLFSLQALSLAPPTLSGFAVFLSRSPPNISKLDCVLPSFLISPELLSTTWCVRPLDRENHCLTPSHRVKF
jgi:hypothetical protein